MSEMIAMVKALAVQEGTTSLPCLMYEFCVPIARLQERLCFMIRGS